MICLLSASDHRVPNQPHSHLLPGQVPAAVDIGTHPPGGGGSSETPQISGSRPLPSSGRPHCEGWHPHPQAEPGRSPLIQPAEPLHLPLGLQVRAEETDCQVLWENILIYANHTANKFKNTEKITVLTLTLKSRNPILPGSSPSLATLGWVLLCSQKPVLPPTSPGALPFSASCSPGFGIEKHFFVLEERAL